MMKNIGTLFYILTLFLLGFLVIMAYLLGVLSWVFILGICLGVVLSPILCKHLMKIWNPINLTPEKVISKRKEEILMVLALAFLVIARVVLESFTENGGELLAGTLLSVYALCVGYMILQAWCHR